MKSDKHIYIVTFHEGHILRGIKVYKSLKTAIKHGTIWEGNQAQTNRVATLYDRDPLQLIGGHIHNLLSLSPPNKKNP